MNRGIYILANDEVLDNAIALLNSIRVYDSETPVIMIPYDSYYKTAAGVLAKSFGVQIYEDLKFLECLSKKVRKIFSGRIFVNPKVNFSHNLLRKLACWFGIFDEFLYIDTDIVVFEKIIDNLKYLSDYDFVHCDYQYLNRIKHVFTSKLLEDNVFSKNELQAVFNSGFWGSKKNLISEGELYQTLEECAAHPEYFQLQHRNTDQPIINYIALKRIKRRLNIVRNSGKKGPGNWAGMPHFKRQDNFLIDPNVNRPLKYLHWAGTRIGPGCPYWDIWRHYRYLNPAVPIQLFQAKTGKNL